MVVYAIVAVAVLTVLGSDGLAAASAPLADAVRVAGVPGLEPVVRATAVVAAVGSLLALILGVSRTTLAMARDHHLPHTLAAVHPRFKVPHHAYYAIANAAAWTLTPAEGRPARIVPVVGLAGCLILAFALPLSSVITGAAVLALGAAAYGLRRAVAAKGR